MHTDYHNATIRKFRDEQLLSASRRAQLEQADRAERLLATLDLQRAYSSEYIFSRIAQGTNGLSNGKLDGKVICHDLRLLIEDLSDAASLPVESAGERVMTADELSKMFDVSTKTITRWRSQGLVGRKFIIDGRKRVGFLKTSVDRFVTGNRERIERSSRFRQMTSDERNRIVQDARRLSEVGWGMNDIVNRLGTSMSRSPGTIRGTIKQYDRDHPEEALFPGASGPLSADVRKRIYQEFRQGDSIEVLAERYDRNKTTIYRVVAKMRYDRIAGLPLDFVANSQFPRTRNDKAIVGPMPTDSSPKRKPRMPKGLPSYLASLYEVPLLSREQEQHLFRKFNYLKYRAARLRDKLDADKPQTRLMDQIEQLYDLAVATKNKIVRGNLRLVVSIAKRHVSPNENFFELISDGNVSLMRAAEKFDFSRGFKFSTYASWAIMKNFARSIPNELKHRERFRTSYDEVFGGTEESRTDWYGQESAHRQRISAVEKILNRLDDREQKIIIHRFGLDYSKEPQTLKQVGEEMGVTKERVRQIEARALNKLRAAAAEERIELPEAG